jgi:hypothetical protein
LSPGPWPKGRPLQYHEANLMPTIIRRTCVVVGEAELKPRQREPPHRTGSATLVFYRSDDEGIRHPSDVVDLLNAEGIETGTLRAQNPITHDQWWIPVVDLAKAGTPFVIAVAAVVRTWLKERKGRQVRLETGRSKITASTVADAERLLAALSKHQKQIGPLHVTKALQPATKNKAAKKAPAKRKRKS